MCKPICYSPIYRDKDYLYRVAFSTPDREEGSAKFGIEMVPVDGGIGSMFVPERLIDEGSAAQWLRNFARRNKLKKARCVG